MNVADLFAGVGGLSLGFSQVGFDVVVAIEFDGEIAQAYSRNHPGTEMINEDITQVDFKELHERFQDIDIVVGGPPCQGFSQKGKRMSINDPRNFLFKRYVDFVEEFSPKYFVIENVPNIITTHNGYFKNEIIDAFNNLGYEVTCGVLKATDFGVPQDRHRAVFIGQKGELQIGLPKPNGRHTTVREAIYDLPFIGSGEGTEISHYDKIAFTDYQKLLRGNCQVLYNHVATKHSQLALYRLSLIPRGKGKEVLPKEHLTKSIYSGTWGRLLDDGIAATITTRFDTPSSGRFTHPFLDRCITVREAARLQSFPDDFEIIGTRGSQYKQVGNAVPPMLANIIAEKIKALLL